MPGWDLQVKFLKWNLASRLGYNLIILAYRISCRISYHGLLEWCGSPDAAPTGRQQSTCNAVQHAVQRTATHSNAVRFSKSTMDHDHSLIAQ